MSPAHDGRRGTEILEGIEVRRLPVWLSHGVSAFIPSVVRQLRGFDALYLHYPFYGGAEAAMLGAAIRRIPVIVYFHMDVLADGLRGAFLTAYQRTAAVAILRAARTVLVSSLDYAKHASIDRLGLRTLQELPFSVDTNEFRPGPSDAEGLRQLGIIPDLPVVLFVGGMDAGHRFKGVPVLIEAIAEMSAGEAQLVLVGDGELRAGFEQLARERCRMPVHFLGAASNETLRELYRAAEVTVLPSTTTEEAFGIVLIESMSSGTPVIASDLPGVRTVFDDATGVRVPPGDSRGLSAAIRSFTRDTARSRRMGVAARESAIYRFSRSRERADLEAVFCRLRRDV